MELSKNDVNITREIMQKIAEECGVPLQG